MNQPLRVMRTLRAHLIDIAQRTLLHRFVLQYLAHGTAITATNNQYLHTNIRVSPGASC